MERAQIDRTYPKIVMHMKTRFQTHDNTPISLDEILDEMEIHDLSKNARFLLDTQYLCVNPKLECVMDGNTRKYSFKPLFTLRNRRDVINLIKDNQSKGLGGILIDDIQDSMTTDEFEKIFIKKPSEEIYTIVGKNRKKVLYYNEKNPAENIQVEEEIIKYWRDVPVEGMDEAKIEEYLTGQGFTSMKDAFANNKISFQANKRKSNKGRQSKKHNEHLGNLLNEYNPDLVRK